MKNPPRLDELGVSERYAVYMMTNEWRSTLYIGVTGDLQARYWQHKTGAVEGFTKKYNCRVLVFASFFDSIDQAIENEKKIKGWTRLKKEALIEQSNPGWKDLGMKWFGASGER